MDEDEQIMQELSGLRAEANRINGLDVPYDLGADVCPVCGTDHGGAWRPYQVTEPLYWLNGKPVYPGENP